MGSLSALILATVGIGMTIYGWSTYLVRRLRHRQPATRASRWAAFGWTALGAFLMLNPTLGGTLVGGQEDFGVPLRVWQVGVSGWLLVVFGSMLMARGYARRRADRERLRAQRRAERDAVREARHAEREARRNGLAYPPMSAAELARAWDEMLAHDKELSRQFLRYDSDLDLAISFPTMRDYRDPLTSAALQAMLRCDELRTTTAPAGTRDVRESAYGRAVTEFGVALGAAEDNARRLVWSNFTDDERKALDTATKMLAFLRSNTTTPAERDVAYRRVIAELSKIPRSKFAVSEELVRAALEGSRGMPALPAEPDPDSVRTVTTSGLDLGAGDGAVSAPASPARAHPWLDVEERARRV